MGRQPACSQTCQETMHEQGKQKRLKCWTLQTRARSPET